MQHRILNSQAECCVLIRAKCQSCPQVKKHQSGNFCFYLPVVLSSYPHHQRRVIKSLLARLLHLRLFDLISAQGAHSPSHYSPIEKVGPLQILLICAKHSSLHFREVFGKFGGGQIVCCESCGVLNSEQVFAGTFYVYVSLFIKNGLIPVNFFHK